MSHPIIRRVAGVGPLLFFAIATVEGFLRADYDPMAQPISALALSERGWIQTINFMILMVSFLAFAAVLRAELRGGFASRIAPFIFVVMAIGALLAGIFPMDAVGGPSTRVGQLHMAAGFLVFPWIPIVLLVVAVRFRRDASSRYHYTLITGLFCLASLVFFLSFVGPPGFARPYPHLVGLVQRLMIFPFFAWITVVAYRATARQASGRYSRNVVPLPISRRARAKPAR